MGKRPDISWLKTFPPGKVVGADDLLKGNTPPLSVAMRGKAKSTNSPEKANFGLIIHAVCQDHQLEYQTEYKFYDKRRWKFDYAIASLKISLEYEGLQSDKSVHTTLVGFTNNCDKYNMAVLLGWNLLRYTAKNYKNVAGELSDLINILKKTK